jgi:hypothetical protein
MAQLNKTGEAASATTGNRRGEDRTKTTVYRPILFRTADLAGFCLLRNLSAGGMMGMVYTNLAPAQPILIEFHPEHSVSGTIAWSADEMVGVRFDREIDVDQTIAVLGKTHTEGWIKRAPRLELKCEGEAVIGDRQVPIRLHDISQRGIKVDISGVRQGEEVTVRLKGLEPHKAVVRWARDDTAGLNFLRPFGLEELARWALMRQSG